MANRTNTQTGRATISQFDVELRRIEQGYLGRVFGSSAQMIHYIALISILLAAALLSASIYFGAFDRLGPFATSLVTFAGGTLRRQGGSLS